MKTLYRTNNGKIFKQEGSVAESYINGLTRIKRKGELDLFCPSYSVSYNFDDLKEEALELLLCELDEVAERIDRHNSSLEASNEKWSDLYKKLVRLSTSKECDIKKENS